MTKRTTSENRIKTVETVFDVVETLKEMDAATITEVAEHLDLAPSTVHGHLVSLEKRGYVVKRDNVYRLGLQFLGHGMHAKTSRVLSNTAQEPIEQLAEEMGEATWTMVEEHGQAIYLNDARSAKGMQTYRLGKSTHLHTTAGGKSILAELPDEQVDAIVDEHGLPARTENTITDRATLFDELKLIRERGYSLNRGERLEGAWAVASPLLHEEEIVGAVGVSGPEYRMHGDRFKDELPEAVLGTKNVIELKLHQSAEI